MILPKGTNELMVKCGFNPIDIAPQVESIVKQFKGLSTKKKVGNVTRTVPPKPNDLLNLLSSPDFVGKIRAVNDAFVSIPTNYIGCMIEGSGQAGKCDGNQMLTMKLDETVNLDTLISTMEIYRDEFRRTINHMFLLMESYEKECQGDPVKVRKVRKVISTLGSFVVDPGTSTASVDSTPAAGTTAPANTPPPEPPAPPAGTIIISPTDDIVTVFNKLPQTIKMTFVVIAVIAFLIGFKL